MVISLAGQTQLITTNRPIDLFIPHYSFLHMSLWQNKRKDILDNSNHLLVGELNKSSKYYL